MTTEKRIAAAITLLESHGYRVTKPAKRGRAKTIDRQAVVDLVARNPEITNAEGAAIIGCSPDGFAKVRAGRR